MNPSHKRTDWDAPFRRKIVPPALPEAMRVAPKLVMPAELTEPRPRTALLINPFYPKDPHASFGKHVLTPTLALTSIAATTPADWEVTYWDENLLQGPPSVEPVPEVVGITVHLTFADRAYALCRFFRALGSKVVLGGLHVLSCPDEAAAHADVIALGDGVQLWPQILEDIERGSPKAVYRATFESDYAADPAPRRDLLPRDSFLTTTSLNATRGCHNRCGFCYLSTKGLRMPYRLREVNQVAREITEDNQPYAVFTDNNLGSNRGYLHELCKALEPLGIIWSAAVTIDVTDDPGLLRAMALSGCTGVFIGLESLNDRNLVDAHKKTPLAEDYARRVAMLHDVGIQVNGSFVLGFDHDEKDVFARTADWIEDNRLECATFHILTPYPNTPLFRKLEAEGRILHRDWQKYDTAHVVFQPKRMSAEELVQGYAWMYKRLFSPASIWLRRPADKSAVPAYLAMSYLYKRSNRLWQWLIENRLTHKAWSPLVQLSRRRQLRFREQLRRGAAGSATGNIVSAGV